MTRKRVRKKDTQDWWEQRLKRLGLGIAAGRNRKLTYVGTSRDLEMAHEGIVQRRYGKVRAPRGQEKS